MMETVSMIEKGYKRALPYGKEEILRKLGQCNDRMPKVERCGPYLLRDGITNIIDGTALAANESLRRSSPASLPPGLVETLKESTIKMLLELLREITADVCENVLDSEVRQSFVKSKYLLGRYTVMMQDVDLEQRILNGLIECERSV